MFGIGSVGVLQQFFDFHSQRWNLNIFIFELISRVPAPSSFKILKQLYFIEIVNVELSEPVEASIKQKLPLLTL